MVFRSVDGFVRRILRIRRSVIDSKYRRGPGDFLSNPDNGTERRNAKNSDQLSLGNLPHHWVSVGGRTATEWKPDASAVSELHL